MENVITISWLANHLDNPDLVILDASHAAVGGQKPPYPDVRIKGARRFDIDYFSNQESSLPHMLAPADVFDKKVRALGINQDSHLVIYDNLGIYSSPRAWWMFKIMGHQKVSVLDGGLPQWIGEGHEVEKVELATYEAGDFEGTLQPEMVKSMEEVKENLGARAFQLIDARSSGRFEGTAPEPRPQLKSGHIPNSINIPFQEVLENGRYKTTEELKRLFGPHENKPLVFSCGSGLTACIVMLAAELISDGEKAVYDGSWTEWASEKGNPID